MSCIVTIASLIREGIVSQLSVAEGVVTTLRATEGIVANMQCAPSLVVTAQPLSSGIRTLCELICVDSELPYIVVAMGTIWLTEDNDFTEWVEVKSNTNWKIE